MAEEMIDVIFYILDIWGIIVRDIPGFEICPSEMFLRKLTKNRKRPKHYGRANSE